MSKRQSRSSSAPEGYKKKRLEREKDREHSEWEHFAGGPLVAEGLRKRELEKPKYIKQKRLKSNEQEDEVVEASKRVWRQSHHLGLRKKAEELGPDKLCEVDELLRKHGYNENISFELGIQLGLQHTTLDRMRALYGSTFLIECLNAWIDQVDQVKEHGGPSYYTLISALRKIGQNRVANAIDQEKHPACAIISRYEDEKSILHLLPQLVIFLYKENLIEEKMLMPSNGLMKEVQQSICADHRNLIKFATILRMTPVTQRIAKDIIKEYSEKCDINEVAEYNDSDKNGKEDIHVIGEQQLDIIKQMRAQFASAMFDATKAMRKISEDDLRLYLRRGYPNPFPAYKLDSCKDRDELLNMLSDECSLTDVSVLEFVAQKFKIPDATEAIQKYKKQLVEFRENALTKCLNAEISTGSPLECEKITIRVSSLAKEYQFKDAEELMQYAFREQNSSVKITIIKDKNSFTITCSFPLTSSELLIANAVENLELLKMKGVLKLTIGHGIVYDDEKEFDKASVYSRKDILEQILLSKSAQLIICFQEKESLAGAAENEIQYQKDIQMLTEKLILLQESTSRSTSLSIEEMRIDSTDIATILYATVTRHTHVIDIEAIPDVTHMFRKYHFYGDQYRKFGIFLNVSKDRLDFIDRNFRGDLARCLIECLMAWLRNPDHPSTKTWETLILAIRHVDEEKIADDIHNEKCKPCEVLPDYYVKLFQGIEEPFELADILCAEGVLDDISVTKIKEATNGEEKTILLKVIQQSICRKKENLKIFAKTLQEFNSTAVIGHEILNMKLHVL